MLSSLKHKTYGMISLGKACGKPAYSLVIRSGHVSTVRAWSTLRALPSRVQPQVFTHFFRLFFTSISTGLLPRPAPVYVPVFRTFHSTYNNHHQMNIEER